MIKKILPVIIFISPLLSDETKNYKYGCPVPDILMQTLKLTENERKYPYLIRTNDIKNLNGFEKVIKKYPHTYENKNDKLVIDCHNEDNCVKISIDLISSGISNIDLGLFQINYDSFPFNMYTYFNEQFGYRNACKVVLSKIKITKDWDWRTLAAYHSLTPKHNEKYKNKLITNYQYLLKKEKEKKENPINENVVSEIKEIKKEIKNDEVKVAHNKLKVPTQKTKSQKEFFKVTKENHFADNKL